MDEGPRGWGVPLYEQVLAGLEPGAPMLDVGCGAGTFTAFAAGRGWTISGADPDRSALAAAERELPDADLRLSEAHELPWPDAAFGLVTLVQVLSHVTNPIAALREAARLCEPGGRVRVTVWGRPDECDVGEFGRALAPFLPGEPRGSSGPPPLTEPDRLRKVAGLAGLDVRDLHEVVCAFDYADADALIGPVLDSALGRRAMMRSSGQRPVRRALLTGMEPFREGTGYRLHNTFRVLDATPADT